MKLIGREIMRKEYRSELTGHPVATSLNAMNALWNRGASYNTYILVVQPTLPAFMSWNPIANTMLGEEWR